MSLKTPLHQKHLAAGARMVDFAGWAMPLHYGSQLEEHRAVRRDAGIFDVSHMTIIDVGGAQAPAWLQYLLPNDIGRLAAGQALYTPMLNEAGGVIDDLIVYRLDENFRLVLNCATRDKDLRWLERQAADFRVQVEERTGQVILAVHGPSAIAQTISLLADNGYDDASLRALESLGDFHCLSLPGAFIARTGYTGEEGLELILEAGQGRLFWDELLARGLRPVGLGARDSLRLEAGMNLYGHDMDEQTSPLSANLARTISWEPANRDFIGREAVERQRADMEAGKLPLLRGLLLEGRGIPREGMGVHSAAGEGVITSGGFSPTLNQPIALARLPAQAREAEVEIRGKRISARVGRPVFVRRGKAVFQDL